MRRGSQERVRRFLDLNLPGGDQADGEPCCLQDAHGGYGSREPSAGALPAAAKVTPQVGTRVMAVFLLLVGSPLAGGCGSGGRRAPTSTEVRHMNVPFSHPSEDRPQKDGRKVRSRWEGTFTFRRAPYGRPGAAPARGPGACPGWLPEAGAGGLRRPAQSSGRCRRGGDPSSAEELRDRAPGCGRAADRRRHRRPAPPEVNRPGGRSSPLGSWIRGSVNGVVATKNPRTSTIPGPRSGGWGIRTPEGLHPTRFPSVRHRPLGESSRCHASAVKSRACATREQYIGRPPPRPARGGGICHAVRRASGGSPAARFAPRRDRSSSAPRSVRFRTEIGPEHTFFRRCSAFGAGAQLPRRRPAACGTDAHRGARGPGCRRPAGGRPQRPRRYPPRLGLRPGPGRIDVRQNDIDRPNPRDASGEPRDCKDLSDTCGAPSLQCHSDGHPVPGVRLTRPLMLRRRPGGRDTGPDDVLSMQSHGAKERRIPLSRIVTVPAACRPSRRRSPISSRK